MTENEALQLFKCLADRSRLQILKSLAIEDMHVSGQDKQAIFEDNYRRLVG